MSNFTFLKTVDPQAYDVMLAVERKTRSDYKACFAAIRQALERLTEAVIHEFDLAEYFRSPRADGRNWDLGSKLYALQSFDQMAEAGYRGPRKLPLPYMDKVEHLDAKGSETVQNCYVFLRKCGNSGSHLEPEVMLCYKNCLLAVESLHKIWRTLYKDKVGMVDPFQEDRMPIEKYIVEKAVEPSDTERSKCIKEFYAYTMDDEGEKKDYALLRLYKKDESTFLLRNQKCFTEAAKATEGGMPVGMARTETVVPRSAPNSDFYVIGYIFSFEPHALTGKLLKQLDLWQRLQICRKLADSLEKLHTSPIPIYHRLLSFESVYLCQEYRGWQPYIVKFDYAKIKTLVPLATVYQYAADANKMLKAVKLDKYLAPEWDLVAQSDDPSGWAKVDVYSLGVLMADILMGSIGNRRVMIKELQTQGVDMAVLQLLDRMTAQDPGKRPAMQQVEAELEKIMGVKA